MARVRITFDGASSTVAGFPRSSVKPNASKNVESAAITPDDSATALVEQLAISLSSQQLALLQMGRHVDRAVHPQNLWLHVYQVEPPTAPVPISWDSTVEVRLQISLWPDRPCPESRNPPDEWWCRELLTRWREIGLPLELLPADLQEGHVPTDMTAVEVATTVDHAVEAALACEAETASTTRSPSGPSIGTGFSRAAYVRNRFADVKRRPSGENATASTSPGRSS